jgi:replicative DNA helicase
MVKKRKSKENDSFVPPVLTVTFLKNCIKLLFSDDASITKPFLKKIDDFFSLFRLADVSQDYEKYLHTYVVKKVLKLKLKDNINDDNLIFEEISSYGKYKDDILEMIFPDNSIDDISFEEIRYLDKVVTNSLKYANALKEVSAMQDAILNLSEGNFADLEEFMQESFEPIVGRLNSKVCKVQNSVFNKIDNFDLSEDSLMLISSETIKMNNMPSSNIKTGIKFLNEVLGGQGHQSGRVYLYAGLPGRWKSGLLLNTAVWAHKYNKDIVYEDGKKPAVLYISLENDSYDTFERMLSIKFGNDFDVKDYEAKQLVSELRENFDLNDDNIQLFIKRRPQNTLSANHIESLMEEISDSGYRVCFLVVDYINLMRSIDDNSIDKRFILGNIVLELSEIAKGYRIPVVTASQMNRTALEAAENLNAKVNDGKSEGTNAIKKMGSSQLGESKLMYDNADAFIIIHPEVRINEKGEEENWLGFKRCKFRGKTGSFTITFYHPFAKNNTMLLKEDLEKEKSLSIHDWKDTFNPKTSNLPQSKKPSNMKVVATAKKKPKYSKSSELLDEVDESCDV